MPPPPQSIASVVTTFVRARCRPVVCGRPNGIATGRARLAVAGVLVVLGLDVDRPHVVVRAEDVLHRSIAVNIE